MRLTALLIVTVICVSCRSEDASTGAAHLSQDAMLAPDSMDSDGFMSDASVMPDAQVIPPPTVGYFEAELQYLPTGRDAPRELPIAFWYPSRAQEGTAAVYYNIFERANVFYDAAVDLENPALFLSFARTWLVNTASSSLSSLLGRGGL